MKTYLVFCYIENEFVGFARGTIDELKKKIKTHKITRVHPELSKLAKIQK